MPMANKLFLGAGTTVALMAASAASANVIVLDFENIAPYPGPNNTLVQDYYNGGTSSIGTSGTNYGVNISNTGLLICLNTPGVVCSNTSRGGLAPGSDQGALFFLSGSETFMNVAAGFTTGFSFFYTAVNQGGTIEVYDGLNGTGNLLASLDLPVTISNCDPNIYAAGFCPFVAAGIGFNGVAKSVSFGGVANQIVFDDITFGSVTPDPAVPEPASWAMMIGGFGLAGGAMRSARRKKVAVA